MCESRAGNGRYLTLGQRRLSCAVSIHPGGGGGKSADEKRKKNRSSRVLRFPFLSLFFSLFRFRLLENGRFLVWVIGEVSGGETKACTQPQFANDTRATRFPVPDCALFFFSPSNTLSLSREKNTWNFAPWALKMYFFFFVKREIRNVFNFML